MRSCTCQVNDVGARDKLRVQRSILCVITADALNYKSILTLARVRESIFNRVLAREIKLLSWRCAGGGARSITSR